MAGKILVLAGAPQASALSWAAAELLTEFQDDVAQFAGLAPPPSGQPAAPDVDNSLLAHAPWRSVPFAKTHLRTGLSQQFAYDDIAPALVSQQGFMSTASVSFASSAASFDDQADSQRLLSQFYEHSLALHEDIPSSALIPDPSQSQNATTFLSQDATSYLSDEGSRTELVKEPLPFRGGAHLTDLQDLPSAAHLTKIQPQTVTCNFIVGIISISPPRRISTRWGAPRYLVEVLVGDETKAGFAITFWLASDDVSRSVLAGLRPQDVVLIQNVALNVFMKKVYGSSLRKDLTKVHLLYRRRLDARDTGGYYSPADLTARKPAHVQLDKTRQVWDWVLRFVGHDPGHAKTAKAGPGRAWDRPPADTQ